MTNLALSPILYEEEPQIDQKILDDYFKFFTNPNGIDMLQYTYMVSGLYYDNLIKNCKDYYLCRDEIEIIAKNHHNFRKYLKEIISIVEIGPGSDYAINNKTLPILNCANHLKKYYAIDCSKNYLDYACNLIKKQISNIKVSSIEADLMEEVDIKIPSNEKKCILFLGGTMGNFTIHQQHKIMNKIDKMANLGDLFILAVDTNQDKNSILKAYSNEYFHNFVKDILIYFSIINPEFKKYIEFFEVECKIDKKHNSLEASLIAKRDLSFNFKNYGKIQISKEQRLSGVSSRKLSEEQVIELLAKHNFNVLEVLENDNKMREFICQKI